MMEKTDETIPSREELAVFIEEAAVSVTNNYEEAPAVLMVDDAVIGTLGNFSASIGKAKSKKTFNVSAIAASALSGRTVLRYRSMFPENKRKILYIDTEQGRHHCQQVLKRILRLAEMPDDKVPENLIMLSLRKFAPRVRLLIVEEAIGTTPDLGLVIIDGIRDFLYDINSSSESTEVISKFMQWTDDKQIHIHTVLHQNKNDEHARGHIGTELNNKAETILQVEVDKDDKAISVVEAVHIRDRDFEPFAFRINEDVLPELVESYLSKEKKCTAPQKLDTFGVFFMKYNYEIRLKAVKLVLEGGLSVREAGCHLGCGRSQVHLWVTLFERHGLTGLKLRHGSYSAEFKLSVLKHMHQNHLSLLETAVHFGIPGPFVIRQWERLYQNQGAEGLRRKPQRRRPAMSKSKTKKVKLKTTPHEELLKELEYLRAENAYLKKLQALVEERIVRESGKEPKPSKD